jgi:hypothetical protein
LGKLAAIVGKDRGNYTPTAGGNAFYGTIRLSENEAGDVGAVSGHLPGGAGVALDEGGESDEVCSLKTGMIDIN